ncbi:MAG: hypothetical protein C4547_10780 [Phycisphaerales bacterium]|nr:MAG: hypothetical protein C4547_10780 [Phycisphaerales bacterium]
MAEWRKLLDEGPPAARVIVAAVLVMLVGVAAAGAATYYWDQYDDGRWSHEANWTGPASCTALCYPFTTNDDAIIKPDSTSGIGLDGDYTIDDLAFDNAGRGRSVNQYGISARQLSCESIVLTAESEVFVTEGVTIIARSGAG